MKIYAGSVKKENVTDIWWTQSNKFTEFYMKRFSKFHFFMRPSVLVLSKSGSDIRLDWKFGGSWNVLEPLNLESICGKTQAF